MMKLNVIYLFKKKHFQLRVKKINIRTSTNFKGELVPYIVEGQQRKTLVGHKFSC